MPVAEVTGLYGIIALVTDAKASKARLDELAKAEEAATEAYEQYAKAKVEAEAAEQRAVSAGQKSEALAAAAEKSSQEAEARRVAEEQRLKIDRERYMDDVSALNKRITDFNDHVVAFDKERATIHTDLEKREKAVERAEATATANMAHANELLADAERRMNLIRSAAA
jgi:hypothetical protein